MNMANSFLQLNNVAVEYYGGYSGCSNVSFLVEENSLVCLFGEKDCGKTSLMKAIGGLEEYSGSILLKGKELSGINIKAREFALTMNKLPKHTKVYKILAYPLSIRKCDKAKMQEKIREVADAFDIFHLLQHTVSMLTPEQKVLVEMARMFMVDRQLYLIDNPLENVYITERTKLACEIITKIKRLNKTVIYTTDRLEEVAALAPDKTIVLCYNQMQDEGTLSAMANKPKSLAAAKVLWQDMVGVVDAEISDGRLQICERDFGVPKLMDNCFKTVKCLIMRDAVSIVAFGGTCERCEVLAVYKYIDKAITKIECDIGVLYANVSASSSIAVGDMISCNIDNSQLLIYDSNSEKLISR